MTAMLNTTMADTQTEDVAQIMRAMGKRARQAAQVLSRCAPQDRTSALRAGAMALRDNMGDILRANAADQQAARDEQRPEPQVERLALDARRVEAMASGIEAVAALGDPLGRVLAQWERPNGLHIQRVSVPLGIIGIIYESRPNVTADAGALCLKSGNAAILRPGSDSLRSSTAIHACLVAGLRAAGLPEAAIQLVPTPDRDAVGEMLRGLDGNLDVIVPRGGKSLVARVQDEARVPVFAHLEGLCHVYVDRAADLDMAIRVVVNAKMRRPGICGAAETLLVDRACAGTHLAPLIAALIAAGCEIRGDDAAVAADLRVMPASEQDWATEYLDAILSVRVVDGLAGALDHLARYSSGHTDAIITEDAATAQAFLDAVDSAIVAWNASTQFADGGEFGMGAEIGIATGKMHARGPIGVEQLTSFKYMLRGTGQTRPA
jgi:glutamate-5-semialdehyde dehydrogenase